MKHTPVIITLLCTLLFLGIGCKKAEPTPSTTKERYTVTIVTAPDNHTTESAEMPGDHLTLPEVMDALGIHLKTEVRNTEVVTSLNAILATASKSWQLYINAKQQTFHSLKDITVSPADTIEWRYEAATPVFSR